MSIRLLQGDCREVLTTLPIDSVHCVVTSPPYYGLRDYGTPGQLGLEATPAEYIANMVGVFREVRRVLRSDGTLWLNIGDAYADKNLIGIPWMLAFALRDDGWYLRSDIIWSKRTPMPESVTDRPTKTHEYLFLLTRSAKYAYDADAIREPHAQGTRIDSPAPSDFRNASKNYANGQMHSNAGMPSHFGVIKPHPMGRNKRSVWEIATEPYPEAHFATYPTALVEPCIKAGCPIGGTVLDPFAGAGTTGLVADRLGRNATLIELNPTYAEMARRRITDDAPMFAEVC